MERTDGTVRFGWISLVLALASGCSHGMLDTHPVNYDDDASTGSTDDASDPNTVLDARADDAAITPPADVLAPNDAPAAVADSGNGCPAGRSPCRTSAESPVTCTNLQTDPTNCGTCGLSCFAGEACRSGACHAICNGGSGVLCSGACVDLQTSATNCGSCGHPCPSGQGCSAGQCGINCGTLATCTSRLLNTPQCANLQSDNDHCGNCETACDSGQTCTRGRCG